MSSVGALGQASGGAADLIRRELRREWRLVSIAIAGTLLGSAAVVVGPTMIRIAIDEGMRAGDQRTLTIAVAVYFVALIVSGIAAGVRSISMARASERFIDRLRVASLAGILRLDLRTFERTRRGDLVARVSADTESLSAASRWVIPEAIRNVTDLIAALVAVAILDPLLALVALIAVPPMTIAGHLLRRRSAVIYPQYRAEIGALVGQVTETVEGTTTVRSHGREADRLALLDAANGRVTDRYLAGTSMRIRFYATITMTRVVATSAVLVTASLLAINGHLTIGTAAAGVLAISTVFGPLAWLTELLDDVLSAKAALLRVVATTEAPVPPPGAPLPGHGALELHDVSFSYVPGTEVLHHVSLAVEPGERVAIVGPTGAGKSTLARVAAGLSAPDIGSVSFGGVDLVVADPDDRRRRILYVLQETAVLSGSIADNVRLVAPDLGDGEVARIADELGLGDWIGGHPDGVRRNTGHAGDALSHGERQLVGVLRVAAADPAVVILDEATAVLDPVTERLVGVALDRALGGRTVVVIAHRVETARRSPRIVRILDGEATEIQHVEVTDVPTPSPCLRSGPIESGRT